MNLELIPWGPGKRTSVRLRPVESSLQRINHHFILSNDFIVAGYPLAFDSVDSSADRFSTIRQYIVEEQMATRTVLVLILFAMMSIILVPLDSGFAQDTKGRWVLGIPGGAN